MLLLSPGVLVYAILFLGNYVSGLPEADRNVKRAAAASHEFVRFAKRSEHTTRDVLVKRGPASSNDKLKLRIALRQEDPAALEKAALEIATPGHPRFRQHLTVDEVAYLTRPMAQAVEGVQSWLSDFGLEGRVENDFVVVDATVDEAEALLNTTYHRYEDLTTREVLVRTEEYSVPRSLHGFIDFVTPTTYAGLRRKGQTSLDSLKRRSIPDPNSNSNPLDRRQQTSTTPCGDGTVVTPACIRYLYNITHNATSPSTTYAVFGTEQALFNQTDLETFLRLYAPEIAAQNPTFEQISLNENNITGGFDQDEVQLDTQWSLAFAFPATGLLYINGNDGLDNFTGDAASDDHYLAFLHDLAHNASVPSVITTSEEDNEGNLPASYMHRVCASIAAAGARGVTFLFSSGDAGIQGAGSPWAVFDLDASFPGSCPFVTTVGGTVVEVDADSGAVSESGLTLQTSFVISSSGGFSTIFKRPAWQDATVVPYVQNSVDPNYDTLTGYNGTTGRGFPDISAVGWNCATVTDGDVGTSGGTSISSPIIAGIITILNDIEASKGRPPLGFINPWLYAHADALNDITTGGQNLRPFEPGFPPGYVPYEGPLGLLGYNVTVGWDAVTGLGSPDFAKMLATLG